MVEVGGLSVSGSGEIAIPVTHTPASERVAISDTREKIDPVEQASIWFADELNRLNLEATTIYHRLETDRSGQVELLTRLGQIAGEKKALKQSDCPELSPIEKELVATQEEVEQLLEQYSFAHHRYEQNRQGNELEAQHAQKDLERLGREINWHLDQLNILRHDVKRES